MSDDREEIPDWEIEEEKVPESLENKWKREEKEGLRAGVCRHCGWPFTKEDLSCRHCGAATDLSEGVLISFKRWFFKTPLGFMVLLLILAGIFTYLIR